MALVIISSELLEIIGLSDRVLVMNQGRVTGLLDKDQISERNIMELAFSNQPLERASLPPSLRFGATGARPTSS